VAVALAAVVLAAVVAAGGVATGDAAAGSVQDGGTEAEDAGTGEANASVQPGERLAGSVGVGEAEFEGEVDSRAFAARLREAETDAERADAVADRVATNRDRVAELRERRERLRERREAGEISEREFRVEMARLAAQARQVERTTDETAAVADDLPADLLAARGANATAIEQLRGNAAELRGGEAAAIAREVAGERAGGRIGPPDQAGPPAAGGNDEPGPSGDDAGADGAGDPASPTPAPGAGGDGDGDGEMGAAADDAENGTDAGDGGYGDAGAPVPAAGPAPDLRPAG